MKAYECLVNCVSGEVLRAVIICEGKEHLPNLADFGVFPADAVGIEDAFEIDLPAAYVLPSGS